MANIDLTADDGTPRRMALVVWSCDGRANVEEDCSSVGVGELVMALRSASEHR